MQNRYELSIHARKDTRNFISIELKLTRKNAVNFSPQKQKNTPKVILNSIVLLSTLQILFMK